MSIHAPIVSVILPVYNGAQYLREAINSIRNQTLSDFEIIAIDDGSTDQSPALLKEIQAVEPRLKIISRANTGIVGALNDGIQAAAAPYLARMDADDIAYPDRLAKQIAHLDDNPELVAIGTWVKMTDADGCPIYTYQTPLTHDDISAQLLEGNGGAIIHPTAVFRKTAVLAAGSYREDSLWYEDIDLYLRLMGIGRMANLPEVLLDYRQHLQSVNQSAKAARARLRKSTLINQFRKQYSLAPLKETSSARISERASKARSLEQWVTLARRDDNLITARKLAKQLVRLTPWSLHSWKILRSLPR